jgi:exopolyphosphatase/guanosine-5'-triphosphate,3'-diphosphate pyrophosphatase
MPARTDSAGIEPGLRRPRGATAAPLNGANTAPLNGANTAPLNGANTAPLNGATAAPMNSVVTAPLNGAHQQRSRTAAGAARRSRTYGALDLGTNNCRLLIARPSPDGFVVVDAYSRVVRLGEGLLESGRLSEAAMDRTVAALAACADKLGRRDVRLTRNVATEACRRAANGIMFVERVFAETGIALDVISPAEEARLAVLGCHVLIDPEGPPALVFDIGGGSTELMLVDSAVADGARACLGSAPPEILDWISMPWGVVSLAETEPQWPEAGDRLAAYERMLTEVQPLLADFADRLAARGITEVQLLGTSGTITTLASVQLGLPGYDRRRVDGCALATGELSALCRSIGLRSVADRARIACVGPDRAELIVAGCAILEAILMRWPGGQVRVADRGIREGILRSLMGRDGVWTAAS